MKKKIKIKSRLTGKVLFEYEKNNNTIKDTVEEAVRQGVSLHGADLSGTDLSGAYLHEADISSANFVDANLERANLNYANLHHSDFEGANLHKTKLWGANLCHAFLLNVDLCGAILCHAILCNADLRGANLLGVRLKRAILFQAYLPEAKNVPHLPQLCPSDGAFVGWKGLPDRFSDLSGYYIIKLQIPEDAQRSSATSYGCRCDKALVLEIINVETGEKVDKVINCYRNNFVYKTGEMSYADSFDQDRWHEHSHGIYFFIDKKVALDYLDRFKFVDSIKRQAYDRN